MSSSLNFHDAVSITMKACQSDPDQTPASWVTLKVAGDRHWHNKHETTIFVKPEDYPYFKRAVEAFNETLEEFYAIKAAAEASANEIDTTVPF